MNKNEITKQNGNIAFVEDKHLYYDVTQPEKKFTSVTTMIHEFTQPFDKNFWSAYKALEKLIDKESWNIEKKSLLQTKKFNPVLLELYNITENDFNREQQAILDSWDEENRKSCERGTKIHETLENSFYKQGKNIDISKYKIGGTFECRKGYNTLDLENGIYPEYLISKVTSDNKLNIAGQIDLLVKKGNKFTICDWKGLPLDTEIPTLEGWSTIHDLKVGDIIFDKFGNTTKILHKSEIHYNPCYKITFDNNKSIIADHEHRWEIFFNSNDYQVITTEELLNVMDKSPKIRVNRSLHLKEVSLPTNPYNYGCRISKNSEIIIENCYQRSSYLQRLQLLSGIMDSIGGFEGDELFYIKNKSIDIIKLLASMGCKINQTEDRIIFDLRDIKNNELGNETSYRSIISIEKVDTIPTQCLEVDSPSHTFLCTEEMIVTHNTNKKIDTKSFFDNKSKKGIMMKYPLSNLPDCNYYHYALQLSTYAWMIQELNPDYEIEDLILVHFDHDENMTVYNMPYLKQEVIKMLIFYKKQCILNQNKLNNQKIEY